jgi:hypothetical protein
MVVNRLQNGLLKKNYVFPFEKKYFNSLALKPLRVHVSLLIFFVAYSQPFNLVSK